MEIQVAIFLLVALLLALMLGIWGLAVLKSQRGNQLKPKSPKEAAAETLANGKGSPLYNHDEGEKIAAPFSEQIEDILNDLLADSPELSAYEIDFGTGERGGLEIWVNGRAYERIEDIPDQALRDAIKLAIKKWDTRK